METLAVSDLALELVVLCQWFYGLSQLLSLLNSITTTTTITTSNTTTITTTTTTTATTFNYKTVIKKSTLKVFNRVDLPSPVYTESCDLVVFLQGFTAT